MVLVTFQIAVTALSVPTCPEAIVSRGDIRLRLYSPATARHCRQHIGELRLFSGAPGMFVQSPVPWDGLEVLPKANAKIPQKGYASLAGGR